MSLEDLDQTVATLKAEVASLREQEEVVRKAQQDLLLEFPFDKARMQALNKQRADIRRQIEEKDYSLSQSKLARRQQTLLDAHDKLRFDENRKQIPLLIEQINQRLKRQRRQAEAERLARQNTPPAA